MNLIIQKNILYGEEMDLISIIVPIYKVENYLKSCLDSIVLQTYKNLEIILIDDDSPDKCPEICDEYAKIDSRIKKMGVLVMLEILDCP